MEISICARFLNRIKEKPDMRPAYAGEMAALRLFRAPRFKLRQGGERGGVVGLDKAVEGQACDVARRDGENLRRSRLFTLQPFSPCWSNGFSAKLRRAAFSSGVAKRARIRWRSPVNALGEKTMRPASNGIR